MTHYPTKGRVVHFVLANGKTRAAEVVNAWSETTSCNLTVKLDAHNDLMFPIDLTRGRQAEPGQPELAPHVRGDTIGGIHLGDAALHVASIRQDEETKAPGTWHWPPRV